MGCIPGSSWRIQEPDRLRKSDRFIFDSAKKVIYLAIQAAAKRWTMPIRDWKPAVTQKYLQTLGLEFANI